MKPEPRLSGDGQYTKATSWNQNGDRKYGRAWHDDMVYAVELERRSVCRCLVACFDVVDELLTVSSTYGCLFSTELTLLLTLSSDVVAASAHSITSA